MGAYVNPKDETKENFLERVGRKIPGPGSFTDFKSDELPVCLINNYAFTAAGICFNERELKEFANIADRPTKWFIVKKSELLKNSNLKDYLRD